jgi:uncharacterized protein YcfL
MASGLKKYYRKLFLTGRFCGANKIIKKFPPKADQPRAEKIMKKILKLSLVIIGLLLVGAVAHAQDLTFSADTTINVNSMNFTIPANSAATSIVDGATTITVVVPSGSQLGLISFDRYLLNNDSSITQTCTGSSNSITITGPATVVVTPVATACTSTAGSGGLTSGGGGGGGGGGGTYVPPITSPTLTVTSVTPTTATISGCASNMGFSTVTGQSCSGNTTVVTTTTPVAIAGCNNGTTGFSTVSGVSCVNNNSAVTTTTSYNLGTVTLRNGSTGEPVKELQRFLNRFLNLGLVIDGKLGPKTITVIKKWQKSKGLVADGLIGPKTKAMMNTQAENGY